ncbi:carotenoid biosynthesis protein [Longivirga aurantiaca]|uniref:Carotenoid biosynthesis protein n=1 Tax=Longivirga aurantiaca TaxID=1837743 RepID=A0ABW1T395_9ACTN
MSVRVYSGPHADRRRGGGGALRALPWILAALTVLAQIAWPLTSDGTRDVLTAVTVVLFFLASASHALLSRGFFWALGWFVVSAGIGLGVEVLGTRTGLPFGSYEYADRLGPMILGVPAVIPLAWAMMSYPALLAARRLTTGPLLTPIVGAVALASWDLFLDPQMVGEGHWTWAQEGPRLPGIDAIPAQNFVAWLLVSLVMMLILDRLPRRRTDGAEGDGVPALLFLWTYFSSVLLNAAFEHRTGVAIWGGVAMGLVALPYAWSLWTGRD